MKFKSSINHCFFCYELLLFALNDLKNYHSVTFSEQNNFALLGNSWLKKTALLIQGGKYKYSLVKKNPFKMNSSFLKKKHFKTLVIQNAFVVLFRLLMLKESTLTSQYFATKGVNLENN